MHLKVLGGGHDGKLISVNVDKFLIGRSEECQLRPKSESISRRHCAIVRKDGNILLIDLKSRNGTHVNEKKLDPSRAKILKNGDKIRVGKLEFEAVMEVGIDKVKKPEVKSVQEAAIRSAKGDGSDSRFEEVDVSMWLDEAEQIDSNRLNRQRDSSRSTNHRELTLAPNRQSWMKKLLTKPKRTLSQENKNRANCRRFP